MRSAIGVGRGGLLLDLPARGDVDGGPDVVLPASHEDDGGETLVLPATVDADGGVHADLPAMVEEQGGSRVDRPAHADVMPATVDVHGGFLLRRPAKELLPGGFLVYVGGSRLAIVHSHHMPAVFEAQRALSLNQQQLATVVGSSLRTVQRWAVGRGAPYPDQITKLAAAVHATAPEIARKLAVSIGQTLESLGIVRPPPPPALPPPAVTVVEPASPDPTSTLLASLAPVLVESVVAAAAEALELTPKLARPAVLAVMERAKAARLSVDDVLAVMRPPPPAPPPAKRAKT